MTTIDHSKRKAADRIRRQGAEAASDLGDIVPKIRKPPKPLPSKSAQLAELADAKAAITRTVRCATCGHSGSVMLPRKRQHARLRCSKCGRTAE